MYYVATWKALKGVMLSKINQKKYKYKIVSLIVNRIACKSIGRYYGKKTLDLGFLQK